MKCRAIFIGAIMLATMLTLAAVLVSATIAGGPTADFGDAPDATNSLSTSMHAYADVTARFPTALQPDASPFGPRHENSPPSSYWAQHTAPRKRPKVEPTTILTVSTTYSP